MTAAASGTLQLGGNNVHRLGFGAMRITGRGVWGPPVDREVFDDEFRAAR